ncbi:MAG: peptidoglycan editing factor PgeF [Candidatus Firestonebacteria bacterium]
MQKALLLIKKNNKLLAFTSLKPFDLKPVGFEKKLRPLLKTLRLEPSKISYALQVHGAKVLVPRSLEFKNLCKADGFVTNRKNYLLCVFTADCLPVVLYDPKAGCIGITHCGWRSTYKGIAGKAVLKMKKLFGSKAGDIRAVFGPSIRPCCYEVSTSLAAKFERRFGMKCVLKRENKVFLNLEEANRILLLKCGLKRSRITSSKQCTFCGKKMFYSYRRDGKNTGRMVTGIIMTEAER